MSNFDIDAFEQFHIEYTKTKAAAEKAAEKAAKAAKPSIWVREIKTPEDIEEAFKAIDEHPDVVPWLTHSVVDQEDRGFTFFKPTDDVKNMHHKIIMAVLKLDEFNANHYALRLKSFEKYLATLKLEKAISAIA